jgi:hypothetical protein
VPFSRIARSGRLLLESVCPNYPALLGSYRRGWALLILGRFHDSLSSTRRSHGRHARARLRFARTPHFPLPRHWAWHRQHCWLRLEEKLRLVAQRYSRYTPVLRQLSKEAFGSLETTTGWLAHNTYVRCALFDSASSFASTTALARSIKGARGMSPYLSALETPQSKLRTSLFRLCSQSGDRRRNTAQHLYSQSGHSGTQHSFCAANQDQENQTIAARSPTFRRVSLKGHPRLYRGVSA